MQMALLIPHLIPIYSLHTCIYQNNPFSKLYITLKIIEFLFHLLSSYFNKCDTSPQKVPYVSQAYFETLGKIACKICRHLIRNLGVQQCFEVVYHELTTLRRVYFARIYSWYTTTKQSYYILLSDFQIRQNEAWVITN